MSVDYTRSSDGDPPKDSESSMFPGTPLWDRNRRRKGGGARRAMFQDTPAVDEAAVGGAAVGGMAAEPVIADEASGETGLHGDDAPFVAPASRTTSVRRERNVAPAAIAVGLIALAALAAAGWYATRPADRSMTPGEAATSIAVAPAATPAAGDATLAANAPPSDAATAAATTAAARTTTTTHHVTTTTTRAAAPVVRRSTTVTTMAASPERPMTSNSAAGSGVNTGATTSIGVAPSAPATAAPPPAAVTPTPPPVNPMPTPAPAPSTTTPDVTPPSGSSAPTTTPSTGAPPP